MRKPTKAEVTRRVRRVWRTLAKAYPARTPDDLARLARATCHLAEGYFPGLSFIAGVVRERLEIGWRPRAIPFDPTVPEMPIRERITVVTAEEVEELRAGK